MRTRPSPASLRSAPSPKGRGEEKDALLRRSLFIDAERAAERLWAADLALRSQAVDLVIVDGSGFDLSATRRLQLAGEANGEGMALLVRPPWELDVLTAATTRWMVRPWHRASAGDEGSSVASSGTGSDAGDAGRSWSGSVPMQEFAQGWRLHLMRCRAPQGRARTGTLERDDDSGAFLVAADVVGGSGATALAPQSASRAGAHRIAS